MKSGAYKGYSRNTRNYTLENNFAAGMHYTDKPILEGEVRLLINLDLSSDKTSLTPRLGLRLAGTHARISTTLQDKHPRVALLDDTSTGIKLMTLTDQQLLAVTYMQNTAPKQCTPVSCGKAYTADALHDVYFHTDYRDKTRYAYCRGFNNNYYIPVENGLKVYGDAYEVQGTFLQARELNASEAVNYGYNMLLSNPYNFVDSVGAEPIIHGVAVYDTNDEICLDPYVNQTVRFVPNMTLPEGTYYYMWLSRTADNDNYSIIKAGSFDFEEEGTHGVCVNGSPSFSINIPSKNYFLQLVLYKRKDFNQEGMIAPPFPVGEESTIYRNTYEDESVNIPPKWYWSPVDQEYISATQFLIYNECPTIATLESSFAFTDNTAETKGPKNVVNYDLSTAAGMTMWNKYLVMYAPTGGENMLFLSAYNEPEFFPYPNNTDIFDENIKYCVPYLNDLLVFTETQLYRLIFDGAGGWVKTMIQGNLHITDTEIPFIQVVKNMVYFKSGDGYFMVVPKSTSMTGELTLAPVSRSLEYFFKHFKKSVWDVLTRTYPVFSTADIDTLYLQEAYSYLNFEDIHNVFIFCLNDAADVVTVDVIYNSVARYWRIYTYTSKGRLDVYTEDATKTSDMLMLNGVSLYYVKQLNDVHVDNIGTAGATELTNVQLLDTGYHDYAVETKKRFRELQFLINNLSKEELNFELSYILDATERIPLYEYTTATEVQNGLGIMYLSRVTEIVPDAVDYNTYANQFCLRQNDYPSTYMWKVRTGISGKGYAPRFQLRNADEKVYEILNFIWVYRIMYLR